MSRSLRRGIWFGAFVFMAATAGFAADESGKCTIATKGDSPVAKACAEGGVKAAKTTMKELVRTAKNNGAKFNCDDCHKNDTTFELQKDAPDKFKKLLAAQTK
jgi:hypothetical protein